MKIVTDIQKPDKEVEVRQIPKSKILIASIRPKKGQFVWKFNIRTKEWVRVEEFKTIATLKGGVTKRLDREPDCLYVVAINKENAAKKVIKLLDNLENLKQ